MGLLDRLRARRSGGGTPAPVEARGEHGTLCAPAGGRLVGLEEVPDPVFSGGVMGMGCAVWPEDGHVFAPLSGTVSVAMAHAVGITGEDGVEALVHVGVDTVEMGGRGFTQHVRRGDAVRAGQPVLTFSREEVARAGHPDCVVLVVSNSDELSAVELAASAGLRIAAGEPVLRARR